MAERVQSTIHTVSQLTRKLKKLIEGQFDFVWIQGEISNFKVPGSGHFYFTLKDSEAQIQAVMFRGQHRHLKFNPQNGLAITGLGRVSLYEPRGSYQVILEHMEPKGAGSLQVAFEQLKKQLSDEGLFDAVHKQKIPFLPGTVAVISSPGGAVIHDIQTVASRRYPDMPINLWPVRVQGNGAAKEIVQAISSINDSRAADVIIIARGGGSLEDLAPFNEESVARAVFASRVPVISAVGHETDFTICDFVSDLRAPTPSAAAEMAIPVKQDLKYTVNHCLARLVQGMRAHCSRMRTETDKLSARLKDPTRQISDLRLHVDVLSERMTAAALRSVSEKRQRLIQINNHLYPCPVHRDINWQRSRVNTLTQRMDIVISHRVQEARRTADHLTNRLNDLDPKAVLRRGYSITQKIPGKRVVTQADDTSVGDNLNIILSHGQLRCRVEETGE